jgi:hypothetical protein
MAKARDTDKLGSIAIPEPCGPSQGSKLRTSSSAPPEVKSKGTCGAKMVLHRTSMTYFANYHHMAVCFL